MKKKVFSLLLAGMLTFSMGTTAYATEDAIADMQAQKQQAEAGLAQTQANIDSLQSKKQELENYLSDLKSACEKALKKGRYEGILLLLDFLNGKRANYPFGEFFSQIPGEAHYIPDM